MLLEQGPQLLGGPLVAPSQKSGDLSHGAHAQGVQRRIHLAVAIVQQEGGNHHCRLHLCHLGAPSSAAQALAEGGAQLVQVLCGVQRALRL
jgi:hypothetical protein